MNDAPTDPARRPIYQRLLAYTLQVKGRIALSMIASLGVGLSDAAYAALVKPLVDTIIVGGAHQYLVLVPAVVVGMTVFKGVARFTQNYFIGSAGQLAVQSVRNDLYSHSMRLSMRFHTQNSTGNLMSRVLNDVGVLQSAITNNLVEVVRESISLVALVSVAFYHDWRLAGLAFLVVPLAAIPARMIGKKIKSYSRRGQQAMSRLTGVLQESFSGFKVIKAFGREREEIEKFEKENLSFYRMFLKTLKYDAITDPTVEIIGSIGLAAVLWYGLHRVLSGAITQGELFSFITALMMTYTPIKRLSRVNNVWQRAMASAERVFEIIDQPIEIDDAPDAVELPRVKGDIEFDGVCFSYEDKPILQDISLRIAAGQVIALVGPSGAGKTTLVGLVGRFYDPLAGEIRIDGQNIARVTVRSLKNNIAMVDQETFLFNESVRDNIRYGRMDANDAEIEAAARLAYADEFINELPAGYDTNIGDRGVRLSGGQRQRLCIARAILSDAPILILDEATSALDTESEAMVQKALGNLMKNRTTLVIAHRLSTVMHADLIVVLDEGRIRETGTHAELLASGGLYKKLYDMQFKE